MGREVVSLINQIRKLGRRLHFGILQITWDNQYQLECIFLRFKQLD